MLEIVSASKYETELLLNAPPLWSCEVSTHLVGNRVQFRLGGWQKQSHIVSSSSHISKAYLLTCTMADDFQDKHVPQDAFAMTAASALGVLLLAAGGSADSLASVCGDYLQIAR